MVATLVICLPSKHSGGELIVHHQGQVQTIEMPGAASGLETDFAAFYADCQHEVKPLLSGYRLCLTYNLVLAKPRSETVAKAPDFKDATKLAALVLSQWETKASNKDDSPKKLAVMLDHRYTEAGLSINTLKGVDLAKANVLFEAAEQSNCDAYLALLTLYQSGEALGGDDDYRYGYGSRRSYYSRYDDEDEDSDSDETDSKGGSEHEMGEIYDTSLNARNWSDRKGKKVTLGRIPFDEDEILSADSLTASDPSREEFEGYTGNAGMTLERWYHRAAIVLWPRSHQYQIWCEAGTDAAIFGLTQMVSKLKKAKKGQSELLTECRSFASNVIDSWVPGDAGTQWDPSEPNILEKEKLDRSPIWDLILKLDAPTLIDRLIEEVMVADRSLSFSTAFLNGIAELGSKQVEQSIHSMIAKSNKVTLERNVVIFLKLAMLSNQGKSLAGLCKKIAEVLVEAIERTDSTGVQYWDAPKIDRAGLLVAMSHSLVMLENDKLLNRFLSWQSIHSRYDLVEVNIPAAIKLMTLLKDRVKGNKPIRMWVDSLRKELESRTREEPAQPTNWRRASKLSCDCADCIRLSAFLADPTQPEARFPLAKHRRQHLHGIIDGNKCDCTHTTLRVGSPQVLVCKKTTASYEQACKTYAADLKHLVTIRKLDDSLS